MEASNRTLMGAVTNILEAKEQKHPPALRIDVEAGPAAFWCALYREVEPLSLVRCAEIHDPDWTPRLHAQTRVALAEEILTSRIGRFRPELTGLDSAHPPHGWRPPMLASYEDLALFASALAAHLHQHATLAAVDDGAWTQRSHDAMQLWRVAIYLRCREAIDRVLVRHRCDPLRSIVRVSVLADVEEGAGDVPADAPDMGFALEVWPLHPRHICFASGLEAVRARLALGLSVTDGYAHDELRRGSGLIVNEALTAASIRALDPNHGD
jgi:hypothetical protein